MFIKLLITKILMRIIHYMVRDYDIFINLVNRGINYQITNSDGNTHLHIAAIYNNADIIKFLIDKNVNINVLNNDG